MGSHKDMPFHWLIFSRNTSQDGEYSKVSCCQTHKFVSCWGVRKKQEHSEGCSLEKKAVKKIGDIDPVNGKSKAIKRNLVLSCENDSDDDIENMALLKFSVQRSKKISN